MKPRDYLEAARVPETIKPQRFGEWRLDRLKGSKMLTNSGVFDIGWPDYTILWHTIPVDMSNIHGLDDDGKAWDVVMEDSQRELSTHLPIWLNAHGRVLITGLGLGCVVRGLLASPDVDEIDVVEIDPDIMRIIGAEFESNPKVRLHLGDATKLNLEGEWDCAWHDIWTEKPNKLSYYHALMMAELKDRCPMQGAWRFDRKIKRRWPLPLIG